MKSLKYFDINNTLAQLRNNTGLTQDQLAFVIYKDPNKKGRIGRIERSEVEPGYAETVNWMLACSNEKQKEALLDLHSAIYKVIKKARRKKP